MLSRENFVSILTALAPATSSKEIVPVFGCFCFDGQFAHAYDDTVAIEVAFPFPIPGAYKASVLHGWASSVAGKDVIIEETNETILFKCGRSKLNLAPIPPDAFLFKRPDTEKMVRIKVKTEAFCKHLFDVMTCVNDQAVQPWQYGVTVKFGEQTEFFTTTNVTIAHSKMDGGPKNDQELLIPPRFCELLLKMSGDGKSSTTKLYISDGTIIADFGNGLKLYSRLGAEPKVKNYRAILAPELLKKIKSNMVPVPYGFKEAIRRILASAGKEGESMSLTVKKGLLFIKSRGKAVAAAESLKFPKHGDVNVRVTADKKLINPILDSAERIAILEDTAVCIANEERDSLFLICLASESD